MSEHRTLREAVEALADEWEPKGKPGIIGWIGSPYADALRAVLAAHPDTPAPTGQPLTEDEQEALAFAMTGPDLFAVVARIKAAARAEALREAADRWTQGAWSDVMLPKPTPPAVPVIAYANRMGDWLRARADALSADAPAPREAERAACGCLHPLVAGCDHNAPREGER